MAENTKIQWTTHTFNPWRGCTKISPGCTNCYAETMSHRNPSVLGVWGDNGTRVVASESMWREPLKWDKAAKAAGKRHRVFCASLADVFEGRPELASPRKRLGQLILDTPNLDWLLLTKRPRNWAVAARDMWIRFDDSYPLPPNVWVGVSVEDQQRADERIPLLLQIPASVRFLSCEPLLGPVDFSKSVPCGECGSLDSDRGYGCFNGNECVDVGWFGKAGLHWVIVGGESGGGSRPFDIAWARSIRDQCRAAGVAYFFKQAGSNPMLFADPLPEPQSSESMMRHGEYDPEPFLLKLRDKKGGDLSEMPSDLQIREFPTAQGGNP